MTILVCQKRHHKPHFALVYVLNRRGHQWCKSANAAQKMVDNINGQGHRARAVALRIHATLDAYERPRGMALPTKYADARTLALTRELTGVNLPRVPHDEAGEL